MSEGLVREGCYSAPPDDSYATLTSENRLGRFALVGQESEDVLKAVVSAHKLLDGYFRRKIVVADFGIGGPPIIRAVKCTDRRQGGDIEPLLDAASVESLELFLGKGIHLISHRAGDALADLVDRFDPITVTAIEQQDEVVVALEAPSGFGSDPTVLPQLERTIRDLLAADAQVTEGAVRSRRSAEEPGPGDLNAGPPLFISRFHDLVDRHPARSAVEYRDTTLTYAELAQLADRMAQAMVDRGLGRGRVFSFSLHATLCWSRR